MSGKAPREAGLGGPAVPLTPVRGYGHAEARLQKMSDGWMVTVLRRLWHPPSLSARD